MGLIQVSIDDVFPQGGAVRCPLRFNALLDARAPAEFALDALPGAVNWPVLNDAQRAEVGTLYKQDSALRARQVGAALVARNIAEHLEREMAGLPREWQPLVYCWRGGQRSGALAWFLAQIGFRTAQLVGGYKAFRQRVREDLERPKTALRFKVLCGRTGSGKTRLLQALADQGAQVLDLEALACHRGSVLGALPHQAQPSQKAFDTQLWQALHQLDPNRPVWVESESRKIGALQLPLSLVEGMREHGHCTVVELPLPQRVQLLLQDYAALTTDCEGFARRLQTLVPLRGHATVQTWIGLAQSGRWAEAFEALTSQHYDPLYQQSMARHFERLAQAPQLALAGIDDAAMQQAAAQLLAAQAPEVKAA